MENNDKYFLTGGIFLTLLINARKQRISARKKTTGKTDGLNESELFGELIKVAFPEYLNIKSDSFDSITSNYKSCKTSKSIHLPFDNKEMIKKFDNEFKKNYAEPLRRMQNFIKSFIDANTMGNWLVRAILEIVSNDVECANELFYINSNNESYKGQELLNIKHVDLDSFLLGIWYFIITKRENNKLGFNTFDSIHEPKDEKSSLRKIKEDIGMAYTEQIDVKLNNMDDDFSLTTDTLLENENTSILHSYSHITNNDLINKTALLYGYIKNAKKKYSQLKTLLYSDMPKDFYDFYVCNYISHYQRRFNNRYERNLIKNATISKLEEYSKFILVTGTGGLGKSMMMRHLLLDALNNFTADRRIPIFIPLKDFDDSYIDLFEFIYKNFESLNSNNRKEDFYELLKNGDCIILLDGLDEIKSNFRNNFEHCLEAFIDKYSNNTFIMSSRPTGTFIPFQRFTTLELNPFTQEQALELIDKLDFRPDEPKIKEKFYNDLENTLFYTHRAFTENPLLLSIMLLTYEQFAEIPSKMHIFYKEAYLTLSQKHDANKGAFKRTLKTELTADRFADYFAEFCARSYYTETFEFSEVMFDKIFDKLHAHKNELHMISAKDFRDDLVNNMCLMFYEGGKYHFTHRSFQEYFSAVYFAKQKDKELEKIGNFFENMQARHFSDNSFNMLYDMIPEKVEEYIFKPYLKRLFEECDNTDGYWTFLLKLYPVIYYSDGECFTNYDDNDPNSFLYSRIIKTLGIDTVINSEILPSDEGYVVTEWVIPDPAYSDECVELDSLPDDYSEYFYPPESIGKSYEVHIDEIVKNPKFNGDMFSLLDNDEFPLKAEFLVVKKYYSELLDREEAESMESDDFFATFH